MIFRFLILMFAVVLTISCDDDIAPAEIPSVVENTFKSHFPDATDVEWKNYNKDFEVDFEVDGTDHSARIDNAGKLLEYKYEISHNILPSKIINVLNTEYAKKKWDEPEILVTGKKILLPIGNRRFFKR